MKTQAELRAFAIGCIAGIAILFGALILMRYALGVAWEPVFLASKPGG